ncbi:hypothetical protein SLE2022_367320 [Rubroshorea leprosula]
MQNKMQKKPWILCLHGFRTSAEILKHVIGKTWPEAVLEKLDLHFLDAPFPARGRSDVESIFGPPYFEWFQFNVKPSFEEIKLGHHKLASSESPVGCLSLHFIGEKCFLKEKGIFLLKSIVDPVVIHHPGGHTILKLDEKSLKTTLAFIEKIQKILSHDLWMKMKMKMKSGL